MSKLLDYFNALDVGSRESFLSRAGMSESYLRRACCTGVKFSAERCVSIEKATAGAVARKDLRPADWDKIWPELVERKS